MGLLQCVNGHETLDEAHKGIFWTSKHTLNDTYTMVEVRNFHMLVEVCEAAQRRKGVPTKTKLDISGVDAMLVLER